MNMGIERMSDRGKLQYLEKNWLQHHLLEYKYHRDCPGIETGPPL